MLAVGARDEGAMSRQGEKVRSPLDRLAAMLGEDVFLVPCEWGTKRPLVTYVERPFEFRKRKRVAQRSASRE